MNNNESANPGISRFSCASVLDEALIAQWNAFHFHHIQNKSIWLSIICGALIAVIGAVMLIMDLRAGSDMLISAVIVLAGALILSMGIRTPKMNEKRMKARYAGSQRQYAFYDHYLSVRTGGDMAECPYNRIKAVYAAEGCWYLYTFSNSAYIVSEQGFSQGDAESFNTFLKSTFPDQFHQIS